MKACQIKHSHSYCHSNMKKKKNSQKNLQSQFDGTHYPHEIYMCNWNHPLKLWQEWAALVWNSSGGGEGQLLWDALSNFLVSLDCFRVLWHFAFIVRPISHVDCASSLRLPGLGAAVPTAPAPLEHLHHVFPSTRAVNWLCVSMQWSLKL